MTVTDRSDNFVLESGVESGVESASGDIRRPGGRPGGLPGGMPDGRTCSQLPGHPLSPRCLLLAAFPPARPRRTMQFQASDNERMRLKMLSNERVAAVVAELKCNFHNFIISIISIIFIYLTHFNHGYLYFHLYIP